ncbi:MAG: GNAT family N-acetyltransferase [Dermatophilaceae bacterium]
MTDPESESSGSRVVGPEWPRHTTDLVLRPPTSADVDDLLRWRNRPEVGHWLMRTTVDPQRFRSVWLTGADDPRDHSVVALLDGRVVASGSLEVVDAMGQDGETRQVGAEGLLGYLVDLDYAGRGYATQVAGALLAVAFEDLGLHRVTAACFADNVASWRVMEKLGMRREQHGVQDSWHAELGWVDGYTYAILREEWLAVR